jgi:hypothetical protein
MSNRHGMLAGAPWPDRSAGGRRQSVGKALMKSAARAIGSQLGRQIVRGVLGSLFGSRR